MTPLAAILAIALSAPAAGSGQNSNAVRAAEARLADQLECTGALAPARTVRTLLAAKIVRNTGNTIDGSSRFEPTVPLRFGPFNIVHLTGWEGTPELAGRKPFTRGPGTAPPTFLQITVRGAPAAVARYLRRSKSGSDIAESFWPRVGTVTVQCVLPLSPVASPAEPSGDAEKAVLAPIEAINAALTARDAAAMLAQLAPEGHATVAVEQADGARHVTTVSWSEFVAAVTPGPERYEEGLIAPMVAIDGDIAMVWAPYTFLVDGKPQQCGVEHYDLIRHKRVWKVLNVTRSSRTTGCTAQ